MSEPDPLQETDIYAGEKKDDDDKQQVQIDPE